MQIVASSGMPGVRPPLASALPSQAGGFTRAALTLAVIAWLNYTIHGYRMPWEQIVVSDGDSGSAMRQAIFAAAGAIACARLIMTQTLGLVLAHYLPWALFALALLCSAAWSEMPSTTIKRAIIFGLGFIAIVAMTRTCRNPARQMYRVVVYTAGISAILSLGMMLALPPGCSSIESRPGLAGISNHPNSLSAVMFTGWIIALGYKPANPIERVWLRINQVAILTALLLTASVTGIIVASAGTACYFILTTTSYRRGIAILASATLIGVIAFVGPAQVKSMAFDSVNRDESLSGRDTLWEDVYREASRRPVFGSGFGGFWYEGRGREITGTWNPRQSHLAYLDVFVDLGVVGVIAVLGLIAVPLVLAMRPEPPPINSRRRAVLASIISLGFAMLAVYGMSQSFLLKLDQFAMFTLLWCLLLLANRDVNAISREFPSKPARD